MATPKKSDGDAVATKRVKLLSYLSGKDGSLTPGSIVELEDAEADRLIGLGAAVKAEVGEEKEG